MWNRINFFLKKILDLLYSTQGIMGLPTFTKKFKE